MGLSTHPGAAPNGACAAAAAAGVGAGRAAACSSSESRASCTDVRATTSRFCSADDDDG